MEVVVLSVTDGNEEGNGVDKSWPSISIIPTKIDTNAHTCGRSVLSEVLCLVSAHESLWLDLGSRTTGKLLIEVDYTLHANSIFGGAESLFLISHLSSNSRSSNGSFVGDGRVGISALSVSLCSHCPPKIALSTSADSQLPVFGYLITLGSTYSWRGNLDSKLAMIVRTHLGPENDAPWGE